MRPRRVAMESDEDDLDSIDGFDSFETTYADQVRRARGAGDRPAGLHRAVIIVGVGLLAVLPLTWLALRTIVDPGRVAAWVVPRASAALHREVTIGEAGIALLPRPGVRVTDVRIGNLSGVEGPSLAAFERVHLDVALLPLLLGKVDITRARVQGARVHLSIDEQGVSNFGDLVPSGTVTAASSGAPVTSHMREVVLTDANLTYFDSRRDRSFAVVGTDGSFAIEPGADGGWRLDGGGVSDSLHVRVPRLSEEIVRTDGPVLGIAMRGDDTFDWVEIERGTIQQSGETLTVQGRVEGLRAADPRVNLTFANPTLGASFLTTLVPLPSGQARPLTEGELDVSMSLKGRLKGEPGPLFAGRVGLSDVGVRLGGSPLLQSVDGSIVVGADSVRLDSIRGTFAEGDFVLDGLVLRESGLVALALAASPHFDALDRMGLSPAGSKLAGEATLDVVIDGSLDVRDSLDVTGTARVRGFQIGHDRIGVPLYVPAAELALSDGELRWSELTVLAGEESLSTSGRWRYPLAVWLTGSVPWVEATLSGTSLDLGGVLPARNPESAQAYAQLAFAHLGDREVGGRRAVAAAAGAGFSRPDRLPLHGRIDIALDQMSFRSHELENVRAAISMTDSMLVVDDASFAVWSGEMTGSVAIGIGEGPDQPFALTLDAEGLDALPFLSYMTPAGESVTGTLSLQLEATGATESHLLPMAGSVSADGRIELSDGSVTGTGVNFALADFLSAEAWQQIEFSSLVADLAVRDGTIEVEGADLRSELGRARFSGAVGMGGGVDLALGLSIPPRHLQALSLRRTGVAQTVLDRLRASGSPLDLGIRVSGSLSGPTLEPDALAASEQRGSFD